MIRMFVSRIPHPATAIALALAVLASPTARACDDILRADREDELPAAPDMTFPCQSDPWTDPDSPITNPGLAPLLFYQTTCAAAPLKLVRRGVTLDLTGTGGCVATWQVEACLSLGAFGDTTQDVWRFATLAAGTRVSIQLDVARPNAMCGVIPATSCATPPDPGRGPLDPKFALFPPGVTPAVGPFNGLQSPGDCAVAATGDTGCLGPTRDPSQDCMVCDNINCAIAAARPGSCASLDVTLPVAGPWSIAVAPQAPSTEPESEGCYILTVSALGASQISIPSLIDDDGTVTFLTAPPSGR